MGPVITDVLALLGRRLVGRCPSCYPPGCDGVVLVDPREKARCDSGSKARARSRGKASFMYAVTWIGQLFSNVWRKQRSKLPAYNATLLGNGRSSPNSNATAAPRIMQGICLQALNYCKRLTKIPETNF